MREPILKLPTSAALQRTEDSLVKQQALIRNQEEIDALKMPSAEHEGL